MPTAAWVGGLLILCAAAPPSSTLFRFNSTVQGQRFNCFRIPSLLWVEHEGASDGQRLVALAEARQFWGDGCALEGVPQWTVAPVALAMRISDDAGTTWSAPKIVAQCGKITCGQSAVYDAKRKRLIVQYRYSEYADFHCRNITQ